MSLVVSISNYSCVAPGPEEQTGKEKLGREHPIFVRTSLKVHARLS